MKRTSNKNSQEERTKRFIKNIWKHKIGLTFYFQCNQNHCRIKRRNGAWWRESKWIRKWFSCRSLKMNWWLKKEKKTICSRKEKSLFIKEKMQKPNLNLFHHDMIIDFWFKQISKKDTISKCSLQLMISSWKIKFQSSIRKLTRLIIAFIVLFLIWRFCSNFEDFVSISFIYLEEISNLIKSSWDFLQ
jgi:hypothetical protein